MKKKKKNQNGSSPPGWLGTLSTIVWTSVVMSRDYRASDFVFLADFVI